MARPVRGFHEVHRFTIRKLVFIPLEVQQSAIQFAIEKCAASTHLVIADQHVFSASLVIYDWSHCQLVDWPCVRAPLRRQIQSRTVRAGHELRAGTALRFAADSKPSCGDNPRARISSRRLRRGWIAARCPLADHPLPCPRDGSTGCLSRRPSLPSCVARAFPRRPSSARDRLLEWHTRCRCGTNVTMLRR